MALPRYWIIVASRDHVMLGVEGGFAQAGHGRRAGLLRMQKGDRIMYYSPNHTTAKDTPLHAFTALGTVADEEIVQVEISPAFKPFRRAVNYQHASTVKIEPLISDLEFIPNKKSWGYPFRSGMFEIQKPDFELIEKAFENVPS
jgi:predicted RNA-binding protein